MISKWRMTAAALTLAVGLTGLSGASYAHDDAKMAIEAGLANPARPAEEVARDANRKPLEILTFAGLKPGMTVLDINSANGYYTDIIAGAVGKNGKVIAQNGPVYWAFVKDDATGRYDGRYDNVVQLNTETEAVDLPEGSVDLAIMVLAYHDYYFMHESRHGQHVDIMATLQSFHKALKKGGKLLVIDHVGPVGASDETINEIHRIDPERVKHEMMEAGFSLEKTSNLLANPADAPTANPFRPDFRGKTDRFVQLYVK